jgi:hypothetical protein
MNRLRRARYMTAVTGARFALTGPASASADAAGRGCGKMTMGTPQGPAGQWKVYMHVRGVTCRRAMRIAESSLFGQGAPPIGGWSCTTDSGRGRCTKGARRLAYAQNRDRTPKL